MLHSKLSRYTLAFSLITAASIALFPAAKGEKNLVIWLLLAAIVAAAVLTLKEK